MMYNDAPPGTKNFTTKRGHTKGILLFNKSQGFWLIHSVPHFPPFPEKGFGYPSTGRRYGQTAMCVTYRYDQFKEIDIYAAWMAQKLGTHLLAETWQPDLPSNCSLQHHIYNIGRIALPTLTSFYSRYDHSKWCVSQVHEDLWACIGDLNRNPQQIWRSGGFICTQNKSIYKAFRNLISYYKPCTDV
ncbi:hypothetical protein FKM82_001832 [Ascaphus truei]